MTDELTSSANLATPTGDQIDAAGAAHLSEAPESTLEELTERVRQLEQRVGEWETHVKTFSARVRAAVSTVLHPTKW